MIQGKHKASAGFLILISWLSARLRWSLLEWSHLNILRGRPTAIVQRETQRRDRLIDCQWVYEHDKIHCTSGSPGSDVLTVRVVGYVGQN